ncbi:lipoxygenase family protein [Stenomitos frigidus]|uniref:Lipoxygenase n=1 Tax=Stenomitos frigidus ULC18 TaxID=2107698 RepID=A0A2T1E9R9_9CYAN|nr:lipoxygenase family protein [Stenomitos frigidus]PSB29454.1 lipoxygenase [Stenomitos frigidus ULC18]
MGFHVSPTQQQGHYRYDPTSLDQRGPARIFPYAGEDGVLRYILSQRRHNLLAQGQVSEPWSLLLRQLEQMNQTLDQAWSQFATLLVDFKILQSGWFNANLPPNEQFDAEFVRERRAMATVLLAAKTAARFHPDTTDRRSHFYQVLEDFGRSRPVVSCIHERHGGLSDREFARQRLAGQNPMAIRQIQQTDQALLQVWSERLRAEHEQTGQVSSNSDAVDLAQAAAERRLFVADYPLLQQLTPANLQSGRYVGSPIAVFYRADTGLEPVLIQVEPGRLVTPTQADTDRWMQAKLFVQTADVTYHELIVHLCDTHLTMEAFAIATPRQLPATHPVYRLLRPHFRFLLAINTRGNTILLGEGAAIDNLMAPTRAASLAIINQAYRERSFQDYALPTIIHQRGIEPDVLPEFPYRDDALLLWEAIARYVTRYLQRYYPDDQSVQRDPYLQAWAAELGAPLDSRPSTEFPQVPTWLPSEWLQHTRLNPDPLPTDPRVPNFPPAAGAEAQVGSLTSLQQLTNIATQVIFTCGPQHAAVNFSQFDYVGYTPNAPLALYSRPDTATSLQQLLPNADQDLAQMELSFALSGIRWGTLGSSELIQFVEAGDRQTLAQFQSDLAAIELKIKARNQQRLAEYGVDYPYLLPSRIPNSINI